MGRSGGPACGESGRNALWGMADACLALACAKLLMKAAASSLHLPPASTAQYDQAPALVVEELHKDPELAICCRTPFNTPEFVDVCGAVVGVIHAESVRKYFGRNPETYGIYPSPGRCLEQF